MSLFAKLARFASSPQGRKFVGQAQRYASSPQGKAKLERARRQIAARRRPRVRP